jgi:hypothetical protein
VPNHTVVQGECINSIAFQYGFFSEVIWGDPGNASLREKRQSPNTLVPGDVVFIPDKRLRTSIRHTGKTHTFKMIGVPALCRIQAFDGNVRRVKQEYELYIDGVRHSGTTDGDGYLQAPMSPKAKKAVLIIGPGRDAYEFTFGELEPVTELIGVQARLNNLGYDCGEPTGEMNDATKEAICQLQRYTGLDVTGKADAATCKKIADLHDVIADMPDGKDEKAEEEDDELIAVNPEDES